jgi:pSer/pThr/pTyr-binding forkhead associated (FHA) protein
VGQAGGTLGRAPDDTIPIADPKLSRYHARIAFADGAFWLSDLGTANGTLVSRARLAIAHQLRSGDVVVAGDTNPIMTR